MVVVMLLLLPSSLSRERSRCCCCHRRHCRGKALVVVADAVIIVAGKSWLLLLSSWERAGCCCCSHHRCEKELDVVVVLLLRSSLWETCSILGAAAGSDNEEINGKPPKIKPDADQTKKHHQPPINQPGSRKSTECESQCNIQMREGKELERDENHPKRQKKDENQQPNCLSVSPTIMTTTTPQPITKPSPLQPLNCIYRRRREKNLLRYRQVDCCCRCRCRLNAVSSSTLLLDCCVVIVVVAAA